MWFRERGIMKRTFTILMVGALVPAASTAFAVDLTDAQTIDLSNGSGTRVAGLNDPTDMGEISGRA